MGNFYIKQIIASGKNKTDAVIHFCKGLNIICGVSDTGKTCVLKCIDFIFGSSIMPFDKSTGYSKVIMVASTNSGNVTFERELGKNQILVSSENANIESGKYNAKGSGSAISTVFLELIGIMDEHKIIKNKDFGTKRLTWRTFLHMFFIKESDVYKEESILIPEMPQDQTAFLSALLFLMTDKDFSEFSAHEEQKNMEAQRAAIERHIGGELEKISKRQMALADVIFTCGKSECMEDMLQDAVDSLADTEKRIIQAVEHSKHICSKTIVLHEKLAKGNLLTQRFQALRSQYIADIKRLNLIVDGEAHMENIDHASKCPLCEGKIQAKDYPHYTEASQSELNRIMAHLNDLDETEKDVLAEQRAIEMSLSALSAEKSEVESLVTNELNPKAHELTQMLKSYRELICKQNEVDMLESLAAELSEELRRLRQGENSKMEYKPKQYFTAEILAAINKYLYGILDICKYEGLESSEFSLDGLDVLINGQPKATTRGKGYRGFINTVLALVFRQYLADVGSYTPGLLIVDSPLLSLVQGVQDTASDSMKTALFRYLLANQGEGQVIVVENEIPNLDYENDGAVVHRFTKGKSHGRYGFLHEVN